MILKRIELRGFRQFVHAEILLDEGITAIIGANGAGKTTILEAIKYALYGEARDKKDTLPNMWHGEKLCVTLEFFLANAHYRCTRTLNDASLEVKNGEDWDRIAISLTGVTAHVRSLLGLTLGQFKNSYFTDQKEIEFLKFEKEKREQQIAQMLGIELLATASRLAKDHHRLKTAEVDGMIATHGKRAAIEAEWKQHAEAQSAQEQLCKAAEMELAKAKDAVKSLEPLHKKAEEWFEIAGRAKARRDIGRRLKQEVEAFQSDVESQKARVQKLQSLEPQAKQHRLDLERYQAMLKARGEFGDRQRMETTLATRLEDLAGLRANLAKKPDVTSLQKAFNAAEESLAAAEVEESSQRRAWESAAGANRSEIVSRERDIKRLEQELATVVEAEARGVCPTCGQPLKEKSSPRSIDLRDGIASCTKELANLQKQAAGLVSEPAALVKARSAREAAAAKQKQAAEALRAAVLAAEVHAERLAKIEALEREVQELRKSLDKAPTAFDEVAFQELTRVVERSKPGYEEWVGLSGAPKDLQAAEKRLADKRAEFENEKADQARDQARMEALGFDEATANEARDSYRNAVGSVPHIEARLADRKKALDAAKQSLADAQNRLEEWDRVAKRIEQTVYDRDLNKEVADALAELRTRLNADVRPSLKTFAEGTLAQITANRYTQIEIDNQFKASLCKDGKKVPVISGGEEDVLALSLRIALSRYVQERTGLPLSLLVLDEVFGSLDLDRRESVVAVLDGLRSFFPQVILISHVEGLQDQADRCLMVRYDEGTKQSFVEERYSGSAFGPNAAL